LASSFRRRRQGGKYGACYFTPSCKLLNAISKLPLQEGESLSRFLECRADGLDHLVYMRFFKDQRWRQGDDVAGRADQLALVESSVEIFQCAGGRRAGT
jgi:hypothetical protein